MTISRRHFLLGSGSAICLSACGGGSGSEAPGDNIGGGTRSIAWVEASRGRVGSVLADVSVGAGVLVARGSNQVGANSGLFQAMSYSTDQGRTWIAVDQPGLHEAATITGMAYGNGRFVAISSYGDVLTSTDGRAWTHTVDALATVVHHPDNMWRVAYGNGVFLVIGARDFVSSTWSSADGLTWTAARPTTGLELLDHRSHFVHVNGRFYRAQGAMCVSADAGVSWGTLRAPYSDCDGIAYGNATYVLSGDMGKLATSNSDSGPWTQHHDIDLTDAVGFVGFVHDMFIVTEGNHFHTSRDGKNWTSIEVGRPGDSFSKVVYDGTHFIAIGSYGLTLIGTPS